MRLLRLQSLAPCHAGSLSQAPLLGGLKVGLSSALPAFQRRASSCIVLPTPHHRLAVTRPPRAPGSGTQSSAWGPECPHGTGRPRPASGSPKAPCVGSSHFSRADGGAQRPPPQRLRPGAPSRPPGETQRDVRLLHVRRSFPEAVPRAQGCGSSAEDSARAPLQLLRQKQRQ